MQFCRSAVLEFLENQNFSTLTLCSVYALLVLLLQISINLGKLFQSNSRCTMAANAPTDDTNSLQGMEVFWQLTKSNIQNRHEAALAIAHWILISHGFRCIGRDADLPASTDPSVAGSEVLPSGWNDRSSGFYSLVYVYAKSPRKMIQIKLVPATNIQDSAIMGQLIILSGTPEVIPFELRSHEYIPENWQTLSSPRDFPEFRNFLSFIRTNIIEKVLPPEASTGAAQRGSAETSQPPTSSAPPASQPWVPQPLPAPPLREFVPPSARNPLALGSRDLDPFGGMGGNVMGPGNFVPGMGGLPGLGGGGLMGIPYRYDPPGPPELMPGGVGIGRMGPRGTVPRGAPRQPGEPDPDHFRPPPGPGDDSDNMFM